MQQTIFDLCIPRDEVLRGELREDIFAARLQDVLSNRADPVYGNAEVFFDNTYPTAGLKTLINDALGRLVGNAAGKNAILRLETSFGGGKTHSLIALKHAASGYMPAATANTLLNKDLRLPHPGEIKIVGVVGSDLDPTVGINHDPDNLKTYTLWGELAYQLGGAPAYELVRESEETKAAVGTGLLETLVGNRPTLILLDEIARHLRAASAVPTKTGKSNLAEQTVAFLMSLLEFAASKERVVVVLTLASDADAFSAETQMLRNSLAEARQVSARQERVLTPTVENEIPAIVTHRLFRSIDRKGAENVFQTYSEAYTRWISQNVDLPQRSSGAEYQAEMRDAYPFHPELLTTLNRKVASIPNFNQTRGALRLLAWTIRSLWETQPANTWMIHLHHIDLSQPQIADDLTARLDRPAFQKAIQADITSTVTGNPAHAQSIDVPLIASGKSPYATYTATTIFLHSLTQGIADGVEPSEVLLSVLAPDVSGGGDDPAVLQHNLERLYGCAWYLDYDGHRYRFKTEPSINKIIADEAGLVGVTRGKSELDRRIRLIWKRGFLQPVFFPGVPADLDDDAGTPKLVILHYDAVKTTADQNAPPDLVRRLYETTGIAESFRKYQNNVLFLVADEDLVENMIAVARRYLGIGQIVGSVERMAAFNKEQKEKLKMAYDAAELEVRIAITRAYRYLYHPSPDAPRAHASLARETLPAQDQGDINQDQTNVIVRVLRLLKRVQTADDDELSAFYVKSKAWDDQAVSMTTEDLRKAFARKIGLRMLLDIGQLRKTIQNGVKTGVWVYYDSVEEFGYDKDSPPPAWSISDDTILYLPEEAARLKVRIKGKWVPPPHGGSAGSGGVQIPVETCPVCGMPIDHCICGGAAPGNKPTRMTGHGPVGQAFQQVSDQCQEHQITYLSRLTLTVSGLGKSAATDLRAIGLAIPQFSKGSLSIHLELVSSFTGNQESLQVQFTGGWDRYKRVKTITDSFSSEADEMQATLRVRIDYDGGLSVDSADFHSLKDILTALQVGMITLEGVPTVEAAG